METTFICGKIARETEKAICLTTLVQWGAGKVMQKDVWFPKSTVIATTENGVEVKHDMAYSISCRNMFKGYVMEFVNSEENND